MKYLLDPRDPGGQRSLHVTAKNSGELEERVSREEIQTWVSSTPDGALRCASDGKYPFKGETKLMAHFIPQSLQP